MADIKDMENSILSGVKITEDKAETVNHLADKLKELDNGVLDPEEAALGDMMGAGTSVKDEIASGKGVDIGIGSQVADQGLLTGVDISEEQAEVIEEVSEVVEEIEHADSKTAEMADTLAVAMGVEKGEE